MQKRLVAFIFLAVFFCGLRSWAQGGADSVAALEKSVSLFGEEKYADALTILNRLLSDPKAQGVRPDALYWTALAYVASGDTVNASKTIDAFLAAYPNHPYVADILYQQGRVLYTQKEYEPALRVFDAFLEKGKGHEMVPSGLFWAGECLFYLGRLEEAEKVYRTLVESYPKNVKIEAATYRLALIRYKYREEELLKLLKWSHEESLKIIEEFQRREKTYEQALSVYQRRLGESAKQSGPLTPDQEITQLSMRIDDLTLAVAERDAKIAELGRALAAAEKEMKSGGAPTETSKVIVDSRREELLNLKAETLELIAFYIDWLAANKEEEDIK
jgi:tetratricopeptide (TPR) repeat protein